MKEVLAFVHRSAVHTIPSLLIGGQYFTVGSCAAQELDLHEQPVNVSFSACFSPLGGFLSICKDNVTHDAKDEVVCGGILT